MKKIAIIGGIAADIEGRPRRELIAADSNPGSVTISYGGVSRNITENLVRMGEQVVFFSVAGDDFIGRSAKAHLASIGADVSEVRLLSEESTAIYLSILDQHGDMKLALCNMDILERIDRTFLQHAAEKAKGAAMVGLDTNLTEEDLEFVTEKLSGTPLFLDPVSVQKAQRVKKWIGRFHTVKPNLLEAEAISGISIGRSENERSEKSEDLLRTAEWFLARGVRRLYLTMGENGVFFADEKEYGTLPAVKPQIVSATGAGDAFSAACVKAGLDGMNIRESALTAMSASLLAMEAREAVNPAMSAENLRARREVLREKLQNSGTEDRW